LAQFDGTNWNVYRASNSGLPDNRVYGLPFDDQGNLWIATYGLARFDGASWTAYNTANSGLPSNLATDVVIDSQQNKWIGTWDRGVARFDGLNWTVYNASNSGLPHNTIWDLTMGADNNLWIATNGGGLARFDGVDWAVYNTGNSGLPASTVHRLAIDPRGNLWMGTSDGLAMFDGERWKAYSTSDSGLPDNGVWCVAFDAQGGIWVGTGNGGLAVFRPRPVVDFNGNGSVDVNDIVRMIRSWGQDDPSCDIGPTPFGDGMVDAADLEVLMSHWGRNVNDPTLVAHWTMDETGGMIAFDSAGENDGMLIGIPAWQPDGGCVDGALEFDGTTVVTANSVLSPSDGPFSVFAWVKGGAPSQAILSQHAGANWLMAASPTGALATELKSAGRFGKPLPSGATITDGDWHRVGFSWDGSARSLYVDGILVAEDTQTALAAGYGGLNIGCGKNLDIGTFFTGLIDDVRIYNRVVKP
jgi:sugar lactone lactonase YvrE